MLSRNTFGLHNPLIAHALMPAAPRAGVPGNSTFENASDRLKLEGKLRKLSGPGELFLYYDQQPSGGGSFPQNAKDASPKSFAFQQSTTEISSLQAAHSTNRHTVK
jgi:hypothetical protein